MKNVMLSIGGRRFQVSCTPGEEHHIAALAAKIDASARAAKAVDQSETRMLLFAALVLADERHDLAERLAATQQSLQSAMERDAMLATSIDAVTQRIENIVTRLEGEADHA
ncbi:cell division protein ZapA [Croceicoccus sp. F390]|uniref:Cell division protein ZapA n=1 Tax=Croceicoccus esteveae TaxID=3075597 RepID=A0ABU2ZMV6_9SPHN|nr:cell division protein ZapA [Croceicoccus sp. F390]MDT0576914.1 cell division protein ZapA [Croceicoccus sp. F390]